MENNLLKRLAYIQRKCYRLSMLERKPVTPSLKKYTFLSPSRPVDGLSTTTIFWNARFPSMIPEKCNLIQLFSSDVVEGSLKVYFACFLKTFFLSFAPFSRAGRQLWRHTVSLLNMNVYDLFFVTYLELLNPGLLDRVGDSLACERRGKHGWVDGEAYIVFYKVKTVIKLLKHILKRLQEDARGKV